MGRESISFHGRTMKGLVCFFVEQRILHTIRYVCLYIWNIPTYTWVIYVYIHNILYLLCIQVMFVACLHIYICIIIMGYICVINFQIHHLQTEMQT